MLFKKINEMNIRIWQRILTLILTIIALQFISCRAIENPKNEQQPAHEELVQAEPASEKDKFTFYKKKWMQYDQLHYRIKFSALCNCSFRTAHNFREEKINGETIYKKDVWLLLEVNQGVIVSVTLEHGDRENDYAVTLDNKSPVTKAFELIELALVRKGAHCNADYDKKTGFPRKVDIDYSGALDDEFQIELKDFELLK